MEKEVLLLELKDSKYLYDFIGESFMLAEDMSQKFPFALLKHDMQQLAKMGYDDSLANIKLRTANLMIQSHVLFGIAPKAEEIPFLKSVFPSFPHPDVFLSNS